MAKSKEEHIEYLKTKKGIEVRQLIEAKNYRKLKKEMNMVIELADYSALIFTNVIESEKILSEKIVL